jgi:hypothetical protein
MGNQKHRPCLQLMTDPSLIASRLSSASISAGLGPALRKTLSCLISGRAEARPESWMRYADMSNGSTPTARAASARPSKPSSDVRRGRGRSAGRGRRRPARKVHSDPFLLFFADPFLLGDEPGRRELVPKSNRPEIVDRAHVSRTAEVDHRAAVGVVGVEPVRIAGRQAIPH